MFPVRHREAEKESEGSAKTLFSMNAKEEKHAPQHQPALKIIVSLQLLPLQNKHTVAKTLHTQSSLFNKE